MYYWEILGLTDFWPVRQTLALACLPHRAGTSRRGHGCFSPSEPLAWRSDAFASPSQRLPDESTLPVNQRRIPAYRKKAMRT